MTKFLKERIGEHQYKAPRKDGNQTFIIDEALIEEFAELEKIQFDRCNPYYRDRVWGLFGEQDGLAHYEPCSWSPLQQFPSFPGCAYSHRTGSEDLVCALGHEDADGVS